MKIRVETGEYTKQMVERDVPIYKEIDVEFPLFFKDADDGWAACYLSPSDAVAIHTAWNNSLAMNLDYGQEGGLSDDYFTQPRATKDEFLAEMLKAIAYTKEQLSAEQAMFYKIKEDRV